MWTIHIGAGFPLVSRSHTIPSIFAVTTSLLLASAATHTAGTPLKIGFGQFATSVLTWPHSLQISHSGSSQGSPRVGSPEQSDSRPVEQKRFR